MARAFAIRRQPGFTTIAVACFAALYAPILILVFYSFNAGTSLANFEGFSLRWFEAAWSNEAVIEASIRSLQIASAAAVLATIAATMAAPSPRLRGEAGVSPTSDGPPPRRSGFGHAGG